MYSIKLLFFVTVLIIFFSSCEDGGSEIPVPSYIEIPDFTLNHEVNAIGITDVWAYIDGEFLGVFELPAKFPVTTEGSAEVTLIPGIEVNGISVTRSYYPFYQPYQKTVELTPTENTILNPQTTYYSWTKLSWSENFENDHKFERREESDTCFMISSSETFSGLYSGAIYLDTANWFFESYTSELTRPDLSGAPGMFIELNYKADNPFEIGVYVYYEQSLEEENIILVNTTDEWKKIYIDLYSTLLQYPEDTPYKIYIASWHDMDNTKSSIFIDDFKVIQSGDK
jgi:hypothetical protein